MVKTLGYVLLWACGSSAAVAVAWTGVASVDDGIVPSSDVEDPVVELSSASGADDAGATSAAGAGTPPSPVSGPALPLGSSGSGSDLPNSDTDPPTATSTGGAMDPTATSTDGFDSTTSSTTRSPGSTTGSTGRPPGSTGTTTAGPTAPPTTPPTTAPPTTATTSPPATAAPAPTQTQTFQLVGGTTAISFSPSEVKVLWATPNPGYEVDIEPESPGIKVRFRSDTHESRVDAWWAGGPKHEIREEAR